MNTRPEKPTVFRWATVMLLGTVLAQLFPILLLPILTRLLSVTEFGLWAIFFSLFSLLLVPSALRLEIAVLTTKTKAQARALAATAITLSAITAPILTLLAFAATSLSENLSSLGSLLILMPLCLFSWSCFTTVSNYHAKKQAFSHVAIGKIVQASSVSVLQVILAMILPKAHLLVAGLIAGSSIATIFLMSNLRLAEIRWLNPAHHLQNIQKNSAYPTLNMPTVFLDTAASQLPLFFIAAQYGADVLAFFALVHRTMYALIGLASRSISQVLMTQISGNHQDPSELMLIVLKFLAILSLSGFVICALVGTYGNQIYTWAFGSTWSEAGKIAELLVISFFVRYCVSPISTTLQALGAHSKAAIWQTASFIAALLIAYSAYSADLTLEQYLVLLVLADVVLYGTYLVIITTSVRQYRQ